MTMSIMIQGTGSNVGKSVLVAGLARAFANRGLKVMPFKPQNMSNNAAVTPCGGEIGRAQALQARAARIPPSPHMNPVLLKPETNTGSQIILQGQRLTSAKAKDYGKLKPQLMPAVLESFKRLSQTADIVIVEGAGSPAEINLRPGDIANMGFAEAADVPVVLVGDIDRGGVIAQLVGSYHILAASDCARIKAFAVNKFRGDPDLFLDGYHEIENRTRWSGLGIIPWFDDAHLLPAEDSMDIRSGGTGPIHIAALNLARIANFDDLDPLQAEPDVRLTMVRPGSPIPGDCDLVIVPGSKSTIGDLAFLRAQGWDIDLQAHVRRGGRVLGICGGYQMLGTSIADPEGIEGPPGDAPGLGLLDVETIMSSEKTVKLVEGKTVEGGISVKGYEIHIGATAGSDCNNAWLNIQGRNEGASTANSQILGTYMHGLFADDAFRTWFLGGLGGSGSGLTYDGQVEATLDKLARHLERHMNVDRLLEIATVSTTR